ncbi:related to cytochrome P450 CYP3/CYP5/CYP6/CYP9 subfamilies [Rhynchosporium agropyri]|uniref:Related to cytochrome P450 CYP3/CYP5/CYP6/CYP9 subfamilies n=1 Tax=Rhynchosporium agropyri TaxID=914238 RepID=A0A1E1L6Z2_9HELO|nr:related to cytochrome P450 CYP3/CYP5/CYP6/CYP9 subfamilies [Rhynchosporium agropyri]
MPLNSLIEYGSLLGRSYISGGIFHQAVILCSGVILLFISKCFYNLWLHPARAYPGPLLGRASRLYFTYYRISGQLEFKTKELHDRYGLVFRIAPNELSYNGGTAWEDIYGHRSKKRPNANLAKDPHFYIGATAPNGEKNLGASADQDHTRIRSVLSNAFSERALYAQEGMITNEILKLIMKLRETGAKPTNAVRWMHHIVWDIITSLTFGESANALNCPDWHPQARLVFEGIREGVSLIEILRFVPFKHFCLRILMLAFGAARMQNFNMSVQRLEDRMGKKDIETPDFMSYILRANETEKELTTSEITANCALLLDAGSETTATMLSGCLFYLLKNQKCMAHLTEILRTTYEQDTDMDSKSLARLPYLQAILEESMRMYMPLPFTLPRKTTREGAWICGRHVPPAMTVGVNQYSACRAEENFQDPDSFKPERWLDDSTFPNDKRNTFQPFSNGPRNCLGKR